MVSVNDIDMTVYKDLCESFLWVQTPPKGLLCQKK